jgi:uncharacterized alpha-E superfamily protein
MLGRVANTIYWMNRHLERAENYARFMDVNFNLSLNSNEIQQWQPLVIITGDWELYQSLNSKVENKVIYFLAFEERNPNSIYNCILNARENARAVGLKSLKKFGSKSMPFTLVKEGQDKRQYVDKI